MNSHRGGGRLVGVLTLVLALFGSSVAGADTTPPKIWNLSQLVKIIQGDQSATQFPASQLTHLRNNLANASYQGPCQAVQTSNATLNTNCWFGQAGAPKVVALFGDSLAGMWIPAMDALGKMDHFRIFVASRKACPFSALPGGSYVDLSCPGWKHNAETFINALHPSMVVFAEKNVGKAVDPNTPSADVATFAAGVATTIRALSAPRKLVLTGVPYFNPGNSMGLDPASCLAVILSTARPLTACDTPVTRAFVATRLHADRLAATSASAINVSLTPLFCGTVNCPIVIDQQIAMSNTFHTPTWYASAVTLALRNIIGPWGL